MLQRYMYATNLDNFLQDLTESDGECIGLLLQQTVTFLCTL